MRQDKFPRIMKLSAMTGKMRKQAQQNGVKDNDLVIVRVTVQNIGCPPAYYSFEKIVGAPMTYLLNRLDKEEKENRDLINSLPSAD